MLHWLHKGTGPNSISAASSSTQSTGVLEKLFKWCQIWLMAVEQTHLTAISHGLEPEDQAKRQKAETS